MSPSLESMCFHVYPTDDGWEVTFDHGQPLRVFDNESAAIMAAKEAAEARSLLVKKPTCVGRGRPGEMIDVLAVFS